MSTSTEYTKAYEAYTALAVKSKTDAQARTDKAKAMQEIRHIEREAARNGVYLSGGQRVAETPTKRSLQEAYVRKFDDKREVILGGEKTTLRAHHTQRLLRRSA